MKDQNIYNLILSHPFIKQIENKEVFQYILDNAKIKIFKKKEYIINQNSEIDPIILFIQGQAKLSQINKQGIEYISELFNNFSVFINNLKNEKSYFCQALGKQVVVLFISKKILSEINLIYPNFSKLIIKFSTISYQQTLYRLEQLSLQTAKERIVSFLLQHYNNPYMKNQNILEYFDNQTISAYLNIRPETFSRNLKILKNEHIILNNTINKSEQVCSHYCNYNTREFCENRFQCHKSEL